MSEPPWERKSPSWADVGFSAFSRQPVSRQCAAAPRAQLSVVECSFDRRRRHFAVRPVRPGSAQRCRLSPSSDAGYSPWRHPSDLARLCLKIFQCEGAETWPERFCAE
jgi:hypothetical protein